MVRDVKRAVLAVLAFTVLLASGAAGTHASDPQDLQGVEPDRIVMHVSLQPDGTAAWRIDYRTRLEDQNASEAFASLEEDIQADPSQYTDRFADRMALTIADAERVTGREMGLRNVTVATTREQLPQETGVVTYRFEWTGFAVVSGDQLRAGDALSGLFLDEGTTFVLAWPETYRLDSASPEPDVRREHAVHWTGPSDFGPDEPRLVVARGSGAAGGSILDIGAVEAVIIVAVVGGLLAIVAVLGARSGWWTAEGPSRSSAESPPPGDDEELLSNEERVLSLLREREGRLKQQEIADTLGWTDAKTSQVIRDLREEGTVETFRLGRENVVTLPDENNL